MFDIAWSELLLIAVLALIFIGPKELPQVLHSLGRMSAKLRRSADDFRRQFEDSMREAGYEDLHKNIQDFRSLNPANQLKESIDRAVNQTYTPAPAAPAEVPASPPVPSSPVESPMKIADDSSPAVAHSEGAHDRLEANGQETAHHSAGAEAVPAAPPGVPNEAVDESAKDRAVPVA